MDAVITFTPAELVGWILAACGGIVAISSAAAVIIKVVMAAKKPNAEQNKRLDALEEKVKEFDLLLRSDNDRLKYIEEGNRVSQRALLALLDHGLDGNNLDQMRKAKDELQRHLVEK